MEFSHDARRTPRWVGAPHILDELTHFSCDDRTPRLAALTQTPPIVSKALLLPGDDRTGLNELQNLLPARPQAREPDPEQAIAWPKPRSGDALLLNGNLMSQGDEFHLHGETRAEPYCDGGKEDQEDTWHDRRPYREGERIRELALCKSDYGRDKCQEVQLIRVFGTHRHRRRTLPSVASRSNRPAVRWVLTRAGHRPYAGCGAHGRGPVQAEATRLYAAGLGASQRALAGASVCGSPQGEVCARKSSFSNTAEGHEQEHKLSRGLSGGKSAGSTVVRLPWNDEGRQKADVRRR